MNTLAMNCRHAAVSSSTQSRSTRIRAVQLLCLLAGTLFYCTAPAVAAELKKPAPSPSDALFDSSRVIQIEIRLDPKDWHALRISHPDLDENLVPIRMNYDYYRGDLVIDGKPVKSVGVRKKGTWSGTARPSLKIKLDEFVKGQEISGLEMLTLNNLLWEPTRAQQSLVYSVMQKAGVVAPRSNLARVVVNGEELGIYGHVESIDKRFIKRHFGDAKGDLYEGQYRADFTTNMFTKIEHKWGPDVDRKQVRQLMEVLEGPGLAPLERIEERVDLQAFLTFWAATVLVGQADGYPGNANNYYFYRDARSGKFSFIPWGADLAFSFAPGGGRVPTSVSAGGFLCRRLWEVPEIRERYRAEMRRLLRVAWDEREMVEELERIRRLREPLELETSDSFAPSPTNLHAQLARRIQNRREQLLVELDAPAREWPLPRLGPLQAPPVDSNAPPMLVEGTFSALIAEAFPTNTAGLLGKGLANLQFTVGSQTRQPFARSGAVAVLHTGVTKEHRIRVVAEDAAGERRWELMLRMDPHRVPLVPSTVEFGRWTAQATLTQTSAKPSQREGLHQQGALAFHHVSTNLGGTISGKFKIHTTAFEEEKKP